MSQTENSLTFGEVQLTLKVADISQLIPIEGEFPSELRKTDDVRLCKIHIRMLPRGFFNGNHLI